MDRKQKVIGVLCAAATAASALSVHAGVLVHESIAVVSTAGTSNNGTSASDMVFGQYQSNVPGWGFDGGAIDVQGNAPTKTGGTSNAANVALSFVVGSTSSGLNSTYGTGDWAIANPALSFDVVSVPEPSMLCAGGIFLIPVLKRRSRA